MNQNLMTMDQITIKMTPTIEVTNERLCEIFDVEKTKQLLKQFFEKEENAKKVDLLAVKLKDCFEKLPKKITEGAYTQQELYDGIKTNIKREILKNAISGVINGNSLNKSIQKEIRKQLQNATVLEIVSSEIEKADLGLQDETFRSLLETASAAMFGE